MPQRADLHLGKLAHADTLRLLADMGFDWSPMDRNVSAAVRFKRQVVDAPVIAGLLGGASSGKSTVFNSMLGREVSGISAHAHETLGPIAAVQETGAERFETWIDERIVFPDLSKTRIESGGPTVGRVGYVSVCRHGAKELNGVVLVDTPDVTSKMATDEGCITRNLLPWFDGLVIIVDEERWFDATVFEETVEYARNLGPRYWVLFNRTESIEPLTAEDRTRLADHAAARHAAGHCISPFQPGRGYRPISAETRRQILDWLCGLNSSSRRAELEKRLQQRCAQLLRVNVTRGEQFSRLRHETEKELAGLTAETSLTTDLLTGEETRFLGLGHRFLPLYDLVRSVRRKLSWFGGRGAGSGEIDFEKKTADLAAVLRRNLEHRFRHACDRINQVIAGSDYMAELRGQWTGQWSLPPFDEREWATRIRAHIDAWKAESVQQSRKGDLAAISVGVPLLLADLVFLGGAGLTLTWAAATLAGFLGGKSVYRLVQRSPAFSEYQTTVRAYQSFIREAVTQQCEVNLAALPRRHLPMSDPILEAVMYWSNPGKR